MSNNIEGKVVVKTSASSGNGEEILFRPTKQEL
jgi:hypothetical protein